MLSLRSIKMFFIMGLIGGLLTVALLVVSTVQSGVEQMMNTENAQQFDKLWYGESSDEQEKNGLFN